MKPSGLVVLFRGVEDASGPGNHGFGGREKKGSEQLEYCRAWFEKYANYNHTTEPSEILVESLRLHKPPPPQCRGF